jgi:hypothetical protein
MWHVVRFFSFVKLTEIDKIINLHFSISGFIQLKRLMVFKQNKRLLLDKEYEENEKPGHLFWLILKKNIRKH